ncbi:biotin transporter BioY [Staphylococcus canis]|uniref:Biotin transporter n=1 Tax=Staphylococcus canis TaxID=2724942 RepID=A0ABS0T9H6_9STAP|nr:biotin transporter BioY [Staphylococcus canis]MBI5974616.1 biotin transporter BioY [Staphylococcus canis]
MKARNLVYTALMTAIIAILGLIPSVPLPFIPVPIVVQNVGIFLAGILLGRKYGFLSVIVFLLLVLIGAPILSGGRGGYGVFFGPTVGYLIMYPITAFLIGWMRDRQFEYLDFKRIFITILIFGVLLLDAVGAIVMGLIIHMPIPQALALSASFLPGDIIKAIIASVIAVALIKNPVTLRMMRSFMD